MAMSDDDRKARQREAARRYYEAHRDDIRKKKQVYMKTYYREHREETLARSARWAKQHPDKIVGNTLRWRDNIDYDAYKSKITTRLMNTISNLMWYDLRRFGILRGKVKGTRRTDIVPWSLEDLIAHLESQFCTGMSWENYGRGEGTWQIDHIKPRSSFVLTSATCKAFRQCWSLSNLRPLWSVDNMKKHHKVREE